MLTEMQIGPTEIANLRAVLKRISFLEHLKVSELDELIAGLGKRPFQAGEVIIRQGDPGETFYVIASGSVGVFRERLFRKRRIAGLQANDYFGEMALIDNAKRTATVIGEESGELYYLPREAFKKVLLSNPGTAALLRQTAEYRRAQNRALDLRGG
jgi:CRP-like cAMP-binding protein